MFIGVSVLSLCEIIETIVLTVMRRRARREMKQRAEASTQLKEETVSENRK